MDFEYTVISNKSVEDVVQAVEQETAKAGFRVLHIHDLEQTLKGKGLVIEPYKIIEICNAGNAFQALKADPQIGILLPCKIIVYQKDGKTTMSGLNPNVMKIFFPDANLGELPDQVSKAVINIINSSK